MSAVLFTGATGIVGSALVPRLVAGGHQQYCLVRKNISVKGAEMLLGDITLPLCGLENIIPKLRGKRIKVVHCAASVKFGEHERRHIFETNLAGTENALDLAMELDADEFHYVSTAYLGGDAVYFGENDLDVGQNPRNAYEESKWRAELLVRRSRFPFSIYRLGIVTGDWNNGEIAGFSGYYNFLESIYRLRKHFERLEESKLEKYREEGIYFGSDGLLNLPLAGNFGENSTLNLTPVDWVADVMAGLINVAAHGETYHIVDPNPRRVRWINDISCNELGVKGFHYGKPQNSAGGRLARFQRAFDDGIEAYADYISHEPKFGVGNVLRDLRRFNPYCINEDYLRRILRYAKRANFGKAA